MEHMVRSCIQPQEQYKPQKYEHQSCTRYRAHAHEIFDTQTHLIVLDAKRWCGCSPACSLIPDSLVASQLQWTNVNPTCRIKDWRSYLPMFRVAAGLDDFTRGVAKSGKWSCEQHHHERKQTYRHLVQFPSSNCTTDNRNSWKRSSHACAQTRHHQHEYFVSHNLP